MKKLIDIVPEQYREELLKKRTSLIKNRVLLLCILAIAIYFAVAAIYVLINPEEFRTLDIVAGLALAAGAAAVIFLNRKSRTLVAAKFNAYLFIVFLLALAVKMGIAYADDAETSATTLVFILFLVSSTIPWTPFEIVLIGVMHSVAYTATYFIVNYVPGLEMEPFTIRDFLDGLIFIVMVLVLCVVIRRKDAVMYTEDFVLLKRVESQKEQMHDELEFATRIQKTLVPGPLGNDRVDIAVDYLPVYYMGGDYAKYNVLDEYRIIFIMCDVTGHGVPAALLVNRIHAEFERLAKEGREPGALLNELNGFIKEDFEGTDMYLTAFCGLLDFSKKELLYSNYGHPPQYLYRASLSSVQAMPAQTALLGLPFDDTNIYQDSIPFGKGDRVLLFTDGVTETFNDRKEEFGTGRVEDLLAREHAIPAGEFNQKLIGELNAFKSGDFRDDIFIMSVAIK